MKARGWEVWGVVVEGSRCSVVDAKLVLAKSSRLEAEESGVVEHSWPCEAGARERLEGSSLKAGKSGIVKPLLGSKAGKSGVVEHSEKYRKWRTCPSACPLPIIWPPLPLYVPSTRH